MLLLQKGGHSKPAILKTFLQKGGKKVQWFKFFSVFCVSLVFLMGGFFAQPAQAQIPCDFNGDGSFMLDDLLEFVNYLYVGGDPPFNPIDCEVDGTPGINTGDVWQCLGIWALEADPMPYTGIPARWGDIEFTFERIRGGALGVPFETALELTDNPGPDLMGIIITFSYQHHEGHVGVNLDNVDFTGTIVPLQWSTGFEIDNVNRRAYISLLAGSADDPPLAAGTMGLIATLTFTRTENPGGFSTLPGPTDFPPTHTSMIITDFYADGTPPEDRILVPKFFPGLFGDANNDGAVDLADAVFIIQWLFVGGPPP
jgi:hypothetical protein